MTRPEADWPVAPTLDTEGVKYDDTGLDHESLFAAFALAGLLARPDPVARLDLPRLTALAWEAARLMCAAEQPKPTRAPEPPLDREEWLNKPEDIPL